jgi:gamma-glutamyltranspeptidase/glutathione hydrolase
MAAISFTTRPEIVGGFGVVAATHWIAAQAGMRMLELGGNAFDAAAAAAFALQVVMPHMNGPGGDVPILFAKPDGVPQVVCGQGTAPARATIQTFSALGLDTVPGTGLLAAVVPGAVGAWLALLRDHGSLDLGDVLAPAIHYARSGWPLHADASRFISDVAELMREAWATSGALWLRDGIPPAPGAWVRNLALGAMYERLLSEAAGSREQRIERARTAFYQGFAAEAIDRFCRENEVLDTSGERHRGLLTGDDMARWRATYEVPLTLDYHGVTICKTGPWGQGPVMLQMLALLKGFDLDQLDPNGADFIHLWVEAAKLAFADRDAFYGDPAFADVPMKALLSEDYNAGRRSLIAPEASAEIHAGRVPGYEARLPRMTMAASAHAASGGGEPTAMATAARPGDTCHIDVIDRWGNVVSATPSGGWLQSSPVIPELGFPLGTRAQMFWLEPGLPNSLMPGKRPRTTLSPSLALRDGQPWLAFGTPGGDKQDQWTLVFLLRHLHHRMGMQEALDAPLFDTDHFRNSFWPRNFIARRVSLEERIPGSVAADLQRRGHDVIQVPDWSLGWMSAASREGERLRAAASPRGMQTYAVGR